MITKEQRDEMRHALGLTRQKKACRNRFVCEPERVEWVDLVKKGLARCNHRRLSFCPDVCFVVTMEGIVEVLQKGEKIDCEEIPDIFGQVSFQKISKDFS